jgi:PAS domain S-box-containing protein
MIRTSAIAASSALDCSHPAPIVFGRRRTSSRRMMTEEIVMAFDPESFADALVTLMPDAVIYADAEGKIRFWNAGATRVFGYTAEEAMDQSLDIIIPENLRERHWTGFDATMRTGQSRYGAGDLLSVPATRKDGKRISVEFTIVPFHDANGRMEGIAAVLRDITPRFEELRALRRQVASQGSG